MAQLLIDFEQGENTSTALAPPPAEVAHARKTRTTKSGAEEIANEALTSHNLPARDRLSKRGRPASKEKSKAHDILTAIRLVNALDAEARPPTAEERTALRRFGGFGPVALRLFPDPATGKYQDQKWQALGRELEALLSEGDYASAKRTTFNAFYTSPVVMKAMHQALGRLGLPEQGLVLEPGCGIGNFMSVAPTGMRFLGVELDQTSGRIARALYPTHDIRIEGFQHTKIPGESLDGVIGNVPFTPN